MSNTNASAGLRMLVPTAEGVTDAVKALEDSVKKGNYILILPNGLVFEDENALAIMAALARAISGEAFDTSHLVRDIG